MREMMRSVSLTVPLTILVILIVATSSAVAVSTTHETTYHGDTEEADQAIETTYTLSPDENEITDVQVNFQHTDDAFVDYDSFSTTTSAGADIEIEYEGNGIFTIDEIQPNEEVEFEFEAYPQDIKDEEIASTAIQINYVQLGQELTETEQISADISSSPWFMYQSERSESEFWDRMESLVNIGTLGAFAIGIGGVVAAGFFYIRSERQGQSSRHSLVKKLKRLENQVESERATRKIREVRNEVEEDETGPTPSSGEGPKIRP
ncbi:hypothetical protein GCM10009647_052210 [Streptomyces sanglieri]